MLLSFPVPNMDIDIIILTLLTGFQLSEQIMEDLIMVIKWNVIINLSKIKVASWEMESDRTERKGSISI